MEWVVNNSESAIPVDRKANQYSHCWKVSLYEIIGTIKRVNPDYSVFCVEAFKEFKLDFLWILVGFQKILIDVFHPFLMTFVKKLCCHESFDFFT